MPLSRNSIRIYQYLVCEVIPSKRVVTYAKVSTDTGVPLGGGALHRALNEIFHECDAQRLPPLPAIVVQEENQYDITRRHGMPGGGYLAAEAESENHLGRQRDIGWERWKAYRRPADTDNWKMKSMIEAHQDSVWDYPNMWPKEL